MAGKRIMLVAFVNMQGYTPRTKSASKLEPVIYCITDAHPQSQS